MSYFPCCKPVGPGDGSDFAVSLVNVGGAAEWYVNATGPNPFEIRTALSSDGSVVITQNAQTIDFTVPPTIVTNMNIGGGSEWYVNATGPNPFMFRTAISSDGSVAITQGALTVDFTVPPNPVSLLNVGGAAEWYINATGPNPFQLRTAISSDGSVVITQNAQTINFTVPPPASGVPVFQVDGLNTLSTNSTVYQTLQQLGTDPRNQIKDGEEWKINYCLEVCHPLNVFAINTWVRWSLETSPGIFTPFDEWQMNTGIQINPGEPSIPFHRTKNLVMSMDDPQMLVEIRIATPVATGTFAERPRWGGVRIAEAP